MKIEQRTKSFGTVLIDTGAKADISRIQKYISGQIVGLISRRSWVRVPLSQYSVNQRRFSFAPENNNEELRRVDSRLHSLGLSLRLLARLRRVKIAYF